MAETGMAAAEYLDLLRTRAGQLLDQGAPGSYPRSLAAATGLITDRLAAEDPAAAELASLCALLAPEPIPEDLFTGATGDLPSDFAGRRPACLAADSGSAGLPVAGRVDYRGLQIHRLTQAILRSRLSPEQAAATRSCTEAILAASNPRDPCNPTTWPRWARLMPHLLAADLAVTDSRDLRWMACDACWYLRARGDILTGRDLARDLHQQWRMLLSGDDEHVLVIAQNLAWALQGLGQYAAARDLDQDTLERSRRVLGEDHPDTLVSASNLALCLRALGEVQAARELDEDTWPARAGCSARTTPTP